MSIKIEEKKIIFQKINNITINKESNCSQNNSENNNINQIKDLDDYHYNNYQDKPNNFFKNFIIDIKEKKNKSFRAKSKDDKEKNLLKEKDKRIEILQEKCQALQKQLQIKTEYIIEKEKKKEKALNMTNKNTNNISINFNFNTSTNFPIKSEIKKIWEEFALISILDNFIDYENKPELIFFFVTEMIIILQELIDNICNEIYEKLSASLGISNDKKFICDIEKTSRPLIKEHLNKIFISTEEKPFINKFIILYKNSLNLKFGEIEIEQIVNSDDFFQMIKKIKDILLYTKFNEPPLKFDIEKNIKNRKCEKIFINKEINRKEYLIINDNGLQNINATIILNSPVMKNGFSINNDLKTIVMIDQNEDNYNTLHLCEGNDNIDYIYNNYIHTNLNKRNKNEFIPSKGINYTSNKFNNILIYNERNMTEVNLCNMNFNINKMTKENNNKNIEEYKEYINKVKINNINKNNNLKYIKIKNLNSIKKRKENKEKLIKEIQKLNMKNQKSKKDYNSNDKYNKKDDIKNQRNKIFSNFSFMSENFNINENLEKSMDQKMQLSESKEEVKSLPSARNINEPDYNNNNFINYKIKKHNKKIKKINCSKNDNIKINFCKINNINHNNRYYSHHKKNSKDNNIISFYNRNFPLLLKKYSNIESQIKSNIFEKMKYKRISNNKINNLKLENFSTEIFNKDINDVNEKNYLNYTNNELIIKNMTVKELFNINKNKNFTKILTNRQKINYIINQNILSGEKKYINNSNNSFSKITNNKGRYINKNRIKNSNLKIILRYLLNENSKNENINKNKILLNGKNTNKSKEVLNANNKIRYVKKTIKSKLGKNILLSPKNSKIRKKTNIRRINNKTYIQQNNSNNNNKKKRNGSLINNNNISFHNLKRSLKNTNNTGYKIKNLNINYFNIIQPNELFYNPQTSRSNSKNKIINKKKIYLYNNLSNSNNSDIKISNTTNFQKNKIIMEISNFKQKNSLYLITDYNYNLNKKNKKISGTNLHQHKGSCSVSSFSPYNFGGVQMANLTKDKKGKKLVKRKIYINDMNSINYNELHKKFNIVKSNTNTSKMQISFIKIPSKVNNIKRDFSSKKKLIFKKLK